MVKYKCDKCLTEFPKKNAYTIHINRKTSCVIEYKVTEDGKIICIYCDKEFTRVDNCKIHISSCNKKMIKIKEDENIELRKQLDEMKKIIDELEKFKKDIIYISSEFKYIADTLELEMELNFNILKN